MDRGDYIFSLEPDDGIAYEYYLGVLEGYTPGSSSGSSGGSTTSAVASASSTSSAGSTTSKVTTTTAATATSTAVAAHYAQCGGEGWTGATTCADGYTCTVENEWYSQCL